MNLNLALLIICYVILARGCASLIGLPICDLKISTLFWEFSAFENPFPGLSKPYQVGYYVETVVHASQTFSR